MASSMDIEAQAYRANKHSVFDQVPIRILKKEIVCADTFSRNLNLQLELQKKNLKNRPPIGNC